MPAPTLAGDRRALSEGAGVFVLVGFTVLVTATVGLNVLVVSETDTGPPQANFTYDYVQTSNALVITHEEGDEFPAGSLVVQGPVAQATWAAVAGVENDTSIGPGSAIQLSVQNAYGQPVTVTDRIVIYHGTVENGTELSSWTGRPGGGPPPSSVAAGDQSPVGGTVSLAPPAAVASASALSFETT